MNDLLRLLEHRIDVYKGNLNFSSRLVYLPARLVDYVIVYD